ncbi:hypothetical protein D210916BOD24_07590 [Alteromonas sp. D210916BOD_24]|uniref:hypothetical protein n=1 Tax=Alteromonas sp. D210916BOD_24 TaxID=3157618 RepID=UPI00399D3885
MHNRYKVLLSTLLCLIITGTATAKDFVDHQQLPAWFNKAVKREASLDEKSDVELAAFPLKGTVEGRWSDVQQIDEYWYFTIDIGTTTPVECWAFKDYDGPANSLVNMMKYAINNIAQQQGKPLSSQYNYTLDMTTLDDTLVMDYQILYNLGEGSDTVSGLIKGLSAESANGLQVCLHNEVGYRKTLKKIFTSFVNAADKSDNTTPFFHAINSVEMNGELVGLASEKFVVDSDGDVEMRETLSMILPVDANNVAATDTVTLSWSTVDGDLINTYQYTVENSELASTFSLSSVDGQWQVEGEIQGKAVNANLEYQGEMVSNFGTYLMAQSLVTTADVDETAFKIWTADTDPTATTTIVMKKRENANGLYQFHVDMEGFEIEYSVDDKFIMQSAAMHLGPISMKMAPLFVTGAPISL